MLQVAHTERKTYGDTLHLILSKLPPGLLIVVVIDLSRYAMLT